ncbi:hypothetical protein MNBD_ALPHA06-2246 [hydrothermal vent metagenome]|uniref:Uncharacterized protein n=1 Tax=hydrothermal vent metagenome TaxID=652676 RepID=A0A3B0RYV8_9ZZZZ
MGRYICLCFFVLFGSPAFAQIDADALLQRVQTDTAQRAEAAKDMRFSYNRTIKSNMLTKGADKPPVDVVMQFDPDVERDQQWTIVSPTETEDPDAYAKVVKQIADGIKNNPDGKPDQDLILKKFAFAGGTSTEATPTLLREENGIAIFKLDLETFANSSDGNAGGIKKMLKNLSGEFSVDIASSRLTNIHIFAQKPFKPVAVAKIKKFDMQIYFAPAWQNGPIFQVQQQMNISGSALFQKFTQEMDTVYSNFEKR